MNKLYKEIVAKFYQDVKPFGYTKIGNAFYCQMSNNWGVINFQKSIESSSERIVFTLNIGIFSQQLGKQQGSTAAFPAVEECHWQTRVGFLIPAKKDDYWWEINSFTDIDALSHELNVVFQDVIMPAISDNIADESLISSWRRGYSPGLTNLERIVNLTSLMKILMKEELPLVVEEVLKSVQGKPIESSVRQYLKEIQYDR